MYQSGNNPWVGLAAYTYRDASRFFGRECEIDNISKSILDNVVTILYGVSGSGKSSLINAGLQPRFEEKQYMPVKIRLDHNIEISYSRQIINAIISKLQSINGEIDNSVNPFAAEDMADCDRLWCFLHLSTFWSRENYRLKPVLLIDQFEEIFTLTKDKSCIIDFFDILEAIASDIPSETLLNRLAQAELSLQPRREIKANIVLAVREDFLARIEDYAYNSVVLHRNRIGLKPLNGLQALDVVIKPIPGLVSRQSALEILCKVTGKDLIDNDNALSYAEIDTSILSLFCREIYLKMCAEHKAEFDHDIISRYGDNIIEDYYERNIGKLPQSSQRYLESVLLTKGGFRDSVAVEDIPDGTVSAADIDRLCAERIIHKEIANGTDRIEFTHDVLCKVAKKRRDKILEKKQSRSQRWQRSLFVFDMLLPVVFVSSLLLWSYVSGTRHYRFGYNIRSAILMTLFLMTIGNDLMVRAAKYSRNKTVWLPILFDLMASVVFPSAAIALLAAKGQEWTVPVFLLYLLSIFVGFTVTLFFKKRLPVGATIRQVYTLAVFRECPSYGQIFYNIFIPAVIQIILALGSFMLLNWPMLILVPLLGSYILLRAIDGGGISMGYFRNNSRKIIIIAGLLLVAVACQYVPYGLIVSMGALLTVAVYVIFLKNNGERCRTTKYVNAFMTVVLVLVLGIISFGYNIFSIAFTGNVRAWDACVRDKVNQEVYIKIMAPSGSYGVIERNGDVIIPAKFVWVDQKVNTIHRYNLDDEGYYENAFCVKKMAGCKEELWYPARVEHLDLDNSFSRECLNRVLKDSLDAKSLQKALNSYYRNPVKDEKRFNTLVAKTFYMTAISETIREWLEKRNWLYTPNALKTAIKYASDLKNDSYIDTTYVNTRFISDLRQDSVFMDFIAHAAFVIPMSYRDDDRYVPTAKQYRYDICTWTPTDYVCEAVHKAVSANHRFINADKKLTAVLLDSLYYKNASIAPISKAYYEVLRGNLDKSIAASQYALATDSSDSPGQLAMIRTNLVTAYFLKKEYDQAFRQLDLIKDVRVLFSDNSGVSIAKETLNDVESLRATGVWSDTTSAQYCRLISELSKNFAPQGKAFLQVSLNSDKKTEILYNGGTYAICDRIHIGSQEDIVAFVGDRRVIITPGGRVLDNGYHQAWILSEDFFGVVTDNNIEFIDTLGIPQIVLPIPTSNEKISADLVFHDKYAAVPGIDGKFGLIDKSGNWAVDPTFDFINNPDAGENFRIYRQGNKYGLISQKLYVFPAVFSYDEIGSGPDNRGIRLRQVIDRHPTFR